MNSESEFDYFAATPRTCGATASRSRSTATSTAFPAYREGANGAAEGVNHFGRALGELNIDIICANSPQARGRVERTHQTLQDRLVRSSGCAVSRRWPMHPALRDVPVVVLTSSSAAKDADRSNALRVDEFVNKPHDVYEYFATVRSTARRWLPE